MDNRNPTMDPRCSVQTGRKTSNGLTGDSSQDTGPHIATSTGSPNNNTRPLKVSKPFMSAVENAETLGGGGVEIVLHANIVTGKELKRALDAMFPGPQEYSVQLRRDRYRVTLPKHNKADIERYVSR